MNFFIKNRSCIHPVIRNIWDNLFIAQFKVYGENVDFYLQGIASLKYVKSKTKKTEQNILKVS